VQPIDPADPIVRRAPVVCVEVLSKGDSLNEMREKVDDYLAMGVQHIWFIDPLLRVAYTASEDGFEPAHNMLAAPGTPVFVDLADIFRRLGDLLAWRL